MYKFLRCCAATCGNTCLSVMQSCKEARWKVELRTEAWLWVSRNLENGHLYLGCVRVD